MEASIYAEVPLSESSQLSVSLPLFATTKNEAFAEITTTGPMGKAMLTAMSVRSIRAWPAHKGRHSSGCGRQPEERTISLHRPDGNPLNKFFPVIVTAAVLASTGCSGGSSAKSSETPSASPASAPAAFTASATCEQLFDKGDDGRFYKAVSLLGSLPDELTISDVTVAVISAGDLKYIAGTANEELQPLIAALVTELEAVAPGPNMIQAAEVQAAVTGIHEICPSQAKDHADDKAAKAAEDKETADIAAKKAADEAAAKAAAEVAAAEAAAAPKEYVGYGDDVVTISKHGTGAQVAVISHTGGSNFAVHTLDAALTTTDLLVNTIGNYSGTVLFDTRNRDQTTALKITAGGPWTVKLVPLASVRSFDGSAPMTGHGDDVFYYKGTAKAATFTHSGSSNIAVHTYGTRPDLLINEIGAYSGTVVVTPGLYTVTADGDWSATLK